MFAPLLDALTASIELATFLAPHIWPSLVGAGKAILRDAQA
jgi:hypothetical protein